MVLAKKEYQVRRGKGQRASDGRVTVCINSTKTKIRKAIIFIEYRHAHWVNVER